MPLYTPSSWPPRTVNANKQGDRLKKEGTAYEDGTYNPQPELFPDVLRRRLIICIRNHLIQARDEVHILNFHKLALHHETRDGEQDRGEHQWDIIGDEGGRVPVPVEEDGEPAEEEDHGDCHDAVPCRVGLEGGFEWEDTSVETLGVPPGSETDVRLVARARIVNGVVSNWEE